MERKVKVTRNDTHWQSRDIGKMVRLCMKAAGINKDRYSQVTVTYSKGPVCNLTINSYTARGTLHISVALPKRGRQSGAPALIQMAAVMLGADGPILPLLQTYHLAKRMATQLYSYHTTGGGRGWTARGLRLRKQLRQDGVRPPWLPESFSIRKYAPKKRPEDNRTFIEKVKDDISRAEERVEKWEAEIEHAEAHLKRAQRDLKKHKKRLRDAKKRRAS